MKRFWSIVLVVVMLVGVGDTASAAGCTHTDERKLVSATAYINDFYNTSSYHSVWENRTYDCPVCGRFSDDVHVSDEAHSFEKVILEEDGATVSRDVCTVCGVWVNQVVMSGCSHGWDYVRGFSTPLFSCTKVAEWNEYRNLGNGEHQLTGWCTVTCNTCGETITHLYADGYWPEACTYNNGVCDTCGYMQPGYTPETPTPTPTTVPVTAVPVTPPPATPAPVTSTPAPTYPDVTPEATGCLHQNADKIWVSGVTEQYDDQRHVVITTYNRVCQCGVTLPQTEETAYFAHTFENNVCMHCGFEQDICAIQGHEWTIAYADGVQIHRCLWCDAMEKRTTPESKWWEEWEELYENGKDLADVYREMTGFENGGDNLWRVIAAQARERLTNDWFVFSTNTLDVAANQAESVVEYVMRDEYSEKQVAIWEELIMEILNDDQGYYEAYDVPFEVLLAENAQVLTEVTKVCSNTLTEVTNVVEWGHIQELRDQMKALTESEIMDGKMADLYETIENVEKSADDLRINSMAVSVGAQLVGAILEGGIAAEEYARVQENFEELTKMYDDHAHTLLALRYDAMCMGSEELVTAAENILQTLTEEYEEEQKKYNDYLYACIENIGDSFSEFMAGGAATIEKVAVVASDFALGLLPAFNTVGFLVKGYQCMTNVDEIYVKAEYLMLLSDMSNDLDLNAALRNEQSSVVVYRLWADLQAEGCDAAASYVNEHVKNWSIHDTISVDLSELGLKENERQTVLNALINVRNAYETYTSLRFED